MPNASNEPYRLKHPIMRGDVPLEEVTIRRATGKDMRLFDQFQDKPMALTLALIEQLGGLTRVDVDKLDGEDVDALGELAFASMPAGRPTGGTD